ncbi:MAG TPA: adenylate/guanylate cyclase domain-containing protein [Pirellulaceae bacterium]
MPEFELRLYENGTLRRTVQAKSAVQIGRQRGDDEPTPFAVCESPDHGLRFIVATPKETYVPRHWFRVQIDAGGNVFIENIHESYPVSLSDGVTIGPRQSWRAGKEQLINLGGGRVLRASAAVSGAAEFRNLPTKPLASDSSEQAALATFRAVVGQDEDKADAAEAFVGLLRQALKVVREAAGSDEFFRTAVEAVTKIVGLERAVLLLPTADSKWSPRSEYVLEPDSSVPLPAISETLLQRVEAQCSTQIYDARKGHSAGSSLRVLNCAVAAPVLDHYGKVMGILYGDRFLSNEAPADAGISDVEATLVEVLAGAVAGGIARQAEERSRARLADFFSPRVAEQLARRPELLTGQDAEVTVLFCDIRGFSRISELMGPTKTIEWLNEVLSELSQCVVDRDGVLVDYVGDQVMAMWGAPQPQDNHAERGLEAAVEMLQRMNRMRETWKDQLPRELDVGIGLNTGMARVGNVGSRLKFKYGVLGNTVNVASRLQDATKQLGVRCIAASATIESAMWQARGRRLAVLNVVGIDGPVAVHEIVADPEAVWHQLRIEYESALSDFENRRFGDATEKLPKLMSQYPEDKPCKLLFRRAAAELSDPSEAFSPIWKFTSK